MSVNSVKVTIYKTWSIEGSDLVVQKTPEGIFITRQHGFVYSSITISQQEAALLIEALTKAL